MDTSDNDVTRQLDPESKSAFEPENQENKTEVDRMIAPDAKLEEDIIRNDTIPETNSDTPGSIGAFPVGAFDTSKG